MTKTTKVLLSMWLAMALNANSAELTDKDKLISKIDLAVEKAMQEWHVPGVALGVIQDGKVIYTKGYGSRNIKANLPMTIDTVMPIGSNTKSFNAVLMAMLVDEKLVAWDKPVIHYLPDFKLVDVYATQYMTVRDLLIHNSGLPRHDLVLFSRKFDFSTVQKALPYLYPSASFRQKFQYQNMMYIMASHLEEKLTGLTWSELVKQRIFMPLNMQDTTTSLDVMAVSKNMSLPYRYENSATLAIDFDNLDNSAGAGSINSSVQDMLKYVQFRLNKEVVNGKSLLSDDQARQIDRSQMPLGEYFASMNIEGDYAMGMMITQHGGHTLYAHGGGVPGFTSAMAWLPDVKLGLVVLTNSESRTGYAIQNTILDAVLGLPQVDHVALERGREKELKKSQRAAEDEFMRARVKNTSPSRPLDAFVGDYMHPAYGVVSIRSVPKGLEIELGKFRVFLSHYHYDVFYASTGPNNYLSDTLKSRPIAFLANDSGVIDRISLPVEPALPPLIFERRKKGEPMSPPL